MDRWAHEAPFRSLECSLAVTEHVTPLMMMRASSAPVWRCGLEHEPELLAQLFACVTGLKWARELGVLAMKPSLRRGLQGRLRARALLLAVTRGSGQ